MTLSIREGISDRSSRTSAVSLLIILSVRAVYFRPSHIPSPLCQEWYTMMSSFTTSTRSKPALIVNRSRDGTIQALQSVISEYIPRQTPDCFMCITLSILLHCSALMWIRMRQVTSRPCSRLLPSTVPMPCEWRWPMPAMHWTMPISRCNLPHEPREKV